MTPSLLPPERQPEIEVHLDGVAARALVGLCAMYLALGVLVLAWFLATDFRHCGAALRQARAVNATLALERDAPPAPGERLSPELQAATAGFHRALGRLSGLAAGLLVAASFLALHRRRVRTYQQISSAVVLMIVLMGLPLLASRLMFQKVAPDSAAWGLLDLAVLHVAACAVMPWPARESVVPLLPLLGIWAVAFLVPGGSNLELLDRVVVVIMSPLMLLPGAALATWRRHHLGERIERLTLGRRVETIGGELSRARIVHEAMFPQPFTGHVSFEYEYQPLQEIGGDYVHAYVSPHSERVLVTVLDVAGHGLTAALTVNRLFGELERILAENESAEPAEVMDLLNRYIYLTMARHSLYATGTCMMIDPNSGVFKWVSAGHPPALLRRRDGTLLDLETTTVLLGATDPLAFEPAQRTIELRPGDTVIAYTDGAYEARDAHGQRFGLPHLRDTARFHPPPRSWPKFLASAVADHAGGRPEDDVLIVALRLDSLRVADPLPNLPPTRSTAEAPP